MLSNGIIPKEKCLDTSIHLLKEGYLYIPNRCSRYKTNIFETRLMGQKTICMSGEEAAQLFYDTTKFTRRNAMPKRIQKSLFGQNSIQTLDGATHNHRKQLFMSIMTQERIEYLSRLTLHQWDKNSKRWERKNQIILFDEAQILLTQVVCKWAGVPLQKGEIRERARDFGAMVDAFGAIGPKHWKGRFARDRIEIFIQNIIQDVRCNKNTNTEDTILHAIALFRDLNGQLLPLQVAAVELINLLRPTIAIASYITFGALALHVHPEMRIMFKEADDYPYRFAQEIRRYYPFAPFVGARARKDFTFNGCHFMKGTRVLLDLYGTNRDPKLWDRHDEFWPDRFKHWNSTPFNFIPQGGGDYHKGNRCPGEFITLEILKISMHYLATKLEYQVPTQDLSYSLSKMPTLPSSGFIMSNIKRLLQS